MSSQLSLFIIVFTLINIAACVWLLWWTARKRSSAAPEGPETKNPTTGHVWDGDLEEYNNPLPRWWLGLFVITVLFGVAYLVIYPGLGNFAGTKGWTQIGAYEAQMSKQRAVFESSLAQAKDKSLLDLSHDAAAMSTARNLFGQNCSTCHGSDARGAKGFPNLADNDWLWGGDDAAVYATIAQGRHGMMPPWEDALGAKGVADVASYVLSLSQGEAPAAQVAAGQQHFATLCAGCHGADARGNPMIGAPNLTDDVWLHGGDVASIEETIAKGRQNQMPAHLQSLGETRVRLLAAYVLSLSNQAFAAQPRSAGNTAEEPRSTAASIADQPQPAS